VAAVARLASEGREVLDEPVGRGLVHGDLIPGNLLVANARRARGRRGSLLRAPAAPPWRRHAPHAQPHPHR
jgi:hypothetical protein